MLDTMNPTRSCHSAVFTRWSRSSSLAKNGPRSSPRWRSCVSRISANASTSRGLTLYALGYRCTPIGVGHSKCTAEGVVMPVLLVVA